MVQESVKLSDLQRETSRRQEFLRIETRQLKRDQYFQSTQFPSEEQIQSTHKLSDSFLKLTAQSN